MTFILLHLISELFVSIGIVNRKRERRERERERGRREGERGEKVVGRE